MARTLLLDKLKLTDGTSSIQFFGVEMHQQPGWRPRIPGLRGNGTWRTPLFDDGQSLVMAQYDDINDVFTLCFPPAPEDGLYDTLMDLFAMLEKACGYWTSSYATEPVWIEAQGPKETNVRYAVVKDWQSAGLDREVFAQGYLDGLTEASQEIQVAIRHGLWQSTPPGTGECVELSAQQNFIAEGNVATFFPTVQGDDAEFGDGIGNIAAQTIRFGDVGGSDYSVGIRFRNVTIPKDATIYFARMVLHAATTNATSVCNVQIKGERNATPAIFQAGAAGWTDFQARAGTTARYNMRPVQSWTYCTQYTDFIVTPIVQEIVDLAGWASGNDMVMIVQNNPWDPSDANANRDVTSWDDPADPAPELQIWYEAAGGDYGQEATCDENVFVANKHTYSQISHVYWWSAAGGWSGNQIGAIKPHPLLPPLPILNGDQVCFGCEAAHPDSGPFCSLVFDVGTATTYSDLGIGNCNITWEYWNGAAWIALTVHDGTSGTVPPHANHSWQVTGVNSVHWNQPSNWAQSSEGPGPTLGWWVRAIVYLNVAETITPVPTQANRDIYTISWPYAETADSALDGDATALLNIMNYGRSDTYLGAGGSVLDLYPERLLIALRTIDDDRGEKFTPYLNISDVQRPNWNLSLGGLTAYAADVTTPTGRIGRVNYVAATGSLASVASFTPQSNDVALAYRGRYRAFLRYIRTAGADADIRVRLRVTALDYWGPYGDVWASEERDLAVAANEVLTHDFGLVDIPPAGIQAVSGTAGWPQIDIDMQNLVAAARQIDLIDLVLMPADEWLIETSAQISSLASYVSPLNWGDRLEVNSLLPKYSLLAQKVFDPLDWQSAQWVTYHTGRAQLHPRTRQRIWWFMFRADASINLPYRAEHEMAISVKGEMAQRYFAVRGAR